MALYLDTTGNSTLGIGICARCSRKMPLGQLMPDPNYPGLMVCEADRDEYDPYRLPARQTERINLEFVRPDLPIGLNPPAAPDFDLISTETPDPLVTEGDSGLITEESDNPGIITP